MNRPKEEDYMYIAPDGHKIFEEVGKEEMIADLKKYCDELEKALDKCVDMYCNERETVLAYQGEMPTEMSIIPRQYVKDKLLLNEPIKDKLILCNYYRGEKNE